MPMLIVQLAALIAIAFIVGCFLGKFLRGAKGKTTAEEQKLIAAAQSTPIVTDKDKPSDYDASVVLDNGEIEAQEDLSDGDGKADRESIEPIKDEPLVEEGRPQWRDAPRRGKADDLTAINGIGNSVASMLAQLGIFHYDQIAGWSAQEAGWINDKIGFRGRVEREEWVEQAVKLAQSNTKSVAKSPKSRSAKANPATKKPKKTAS